MKQPATQVRNRVLKLQIRYSSLMLILSLIMGLIYREFSRPFFDGLPLVEQLKYGHAMSIAHGHTFLLGTAIPLGMALITFLLQSELSEAATLTRLRRLFITYIVSASANVALIVYQGLSFIARAVLDFATRTFAPDGYRVTIAAFNRRAQRVWETWGFRETQRFRGGRDHRPFVVMAVLH